MTDFSNLYQFKHLKQEIEGMLIFVKFLPLKEKNRIINKLMEIKAQIKEIQKYNELFNEHYISRGWIVYDSMNADLIRRCVTLAERGLIDEGEAELVKYYKDEENIRYLLILLKNIEELRKRYVLIEKAYTDFKSERYYSCVPIFFAIIDGAFGEAVKHTGFFSENSNLELWDSMLGHDEGLIALRKIIYSGRKGFNTNPVYIPYRNGIIHGKDISYDNELVGAKTLALLFTVADWIREYKSGKHIKPEPEPKKTIVENLKDIKEFLIRINNISKKNKENNKQIESWTPRSFNDKYLKDLLFDEDSPERMLMDFLEAWKRKNYGIMAQMMVSVDNEHTGIVAGRLRRETDTYSLNDYRFIEIKDTAPVITIIKVNIMIENNAGIYNTDMKISMVHQKSRNDTMPVLRNEECGHWFLFESTEYDLESVLSKVMIEEAQKQDNKQ